MDITLCVKKETQPSFFMWQKQSDWKAGSKKESTTAENYILVNVLLEMADKQAESLRQRFNCQKFK